MRIHTDKLTGAELRQALAQCRGVPVYLDRCDPHGSRSHARAYDVALVVYEGGPGTENPYRRNPGDGRGFDPYEWAASYDQWGDWLAELFRLDPKINAGGKYGYNGAADFRAQLVARKRWRPEWSRTRRAFLVGHPGRHNPKGDRR